MFFQQNPSQVFPANSQGLPQTLKLFLHILSDKTNVLLSDGLIVHSAMSTLVCFTFMYGMYVSLETTSIFTFLFTMLTMIYFTFMYRLYVSSETNLVCKIMATKRTAMFEQIHKRPATKSAAKASLSAVNLKACTCSVCRYNTFSFHQAALNT